MRLLNLTVILLLGLFLTTTPVLAELPANFDETVDNAIAEASARTDAKFNIEAYKAQLQADISCGPLLRLAQEGNRLRVRLIYAEEYAKEELVTEMVQRLLQTCEDILHPKPPEPPPLIPSVDEWLLKSSDALRP